MGLEFPHGWLCVCGTNSRSELVPVDWSNDSDESEEEEEIQEERARAMDECEDEK